MAKPRVLFVVLLSLLIVAGTVPYIPAMANPASVSDLVAERIPDAPGGSVTPSSKVEGALLKQLNDGAGVADVILWMTEKADLGPASQLSSKVEKGRFVFETLRATAERSQTSLRAYLDAHGASYRAFYISNKILVRGVDGELVMALAARPEVLKITVNHRYQLEEPKINPKGDQGTEAVGENITFLNTDDVWALGFTGQGIVLAGNDTGLAWEHPAIISHYRGWNGLVADHNYNWWDATATYPTAPNDGHGHGTHTTGTMVGDDGGANQIGMAPGATTVHCKNMDDFGSGWDATFIECFEWDLAPWDLNRQNPRPDLAPHAVNNSWGYWGGGNPAFQDEIAALQAAGILIEVSAGNEGPGCGTLRSPSDYGEVLTTGSVSHASGSLPGSLTWFSSRGPSTLTDEFVPDVMAPGENIRSAVPGGYYQNWDGTSMAGPHVVGLVALMWAANPGLRGMIMETQQIIQSTSVPLVGQTGSNCGGDYEVGPNHDWGYGTIDALSAVQAASAFGGTGILSGTVVDSADSSPLPNALIKATLQAGLTWQTRSDAAGQYARAVFSGTYTVTASLYGYFPALHTGIQVISGTTTTLDIPLDRAPEYTLSGRVTDATTGWPLYAEIHVAGYPYGSVWSDPLTGEYSIRLAAGADYAFRVTAWEAGYKPLMRQIPAPSSDQVIDLPLQADLTACAAPGYQAEYVYLQDLESSDGGFTVDGNGSWQWGGPTSGPRAAHSGNNVWATNLAGDYGNGEDSTITSPPIDLGGFAGRTVIVTWWQWLQSEDWFDYGTVQVSNDGGLNWMTIYWNTGRVDTAWTKVNLSLHESFATSDFRIRFQFWSDGSITAPGFYIDDIGVGVAISQPDLYREDLADDGGYVVGGVSSWSWGAPTRGPIGAHTAPFAWGTNLDGNYGDNEDGYLTSPPIDLTAAGDQPMLLSWWGWLQTESGYDFASVEISDGIGWTTILSASGILTTDWSEFGFFLEPTYSVPEFQIRFRLQSDNSVTYPGFYVDDVSISIFSDAPPMLPCNPLTGGLVVGHVLDANSGQAVDGAQVTGLAGAAISRPTPTDAAVADGFYAVFAPEGTQVLTATMTGGYGTDTQNPMVVPGDAVRQDFSLPAGLLWSNPPQLGATLDMGVTATLLITLENGGALPATFELREKAGPFNPTTVIGVTIPEFRPTGIDENSYTGQGAQVPEARPARLFLPPKAAAYLTTSADVLLVAAADVAQIQAILQAFPGLASVDVLDVRNSTPALPELQPYDTVVLVANNAFADPVALGNVLADYIDAGGTIVQTVPTFYDQWGNGWGIAGRFLEQGYSPFVGTGDWFAWASLGAYDPSHPIMEGVTDAGDYYRQAVELAPGAELVASWTDDEFVAVRDQVVALNTFLSDGYAWTGDVPLIVYNSIAWLLSGGDVPWLFVEPISGTLAATSFQAVQVTFDASVPEITQPGSYAAEIRLVDDTPYSAAAVPVTMTVNPPGDWGAVAGLVTGLGVCDAEGVPLPAADVTISGAPPFQTNQDGEYRYWVPEGTYTVTVSAAGFQEAGYVAAVIAGQVHTHDVELRLDAPCATISPSAFEFTLIQGGYVTAPLQLDNSGAGFLEYAIWETAYELTPVPLSLHQGSGRTLGESRRAGATSMLSLAAADEPAQATAQPLSGWFGGLDVPGGLVRYGFVQCPEQPESYYLFAGIDGSSRLSTKSWRYDASSNTWTQLADIPGAGEAPAAACYQNRVYVMGGSGTTQFYVYDISADRWGSAAPLPRSVEGAAAAAWDGRIYLVGGDDDFSPFNGVSGLVNIYDIATDAWLADGAALPVPAGNAGYVQAGPFLYVVGGWGNSAPQTNVRATMRYDLRNDLWEEGPEFSSARADLALAITGSALYALGGDKDGGGFLEPTSAAERLSLAAWPAGSWEDLNDALPVAFSANNAGFCTEALVDRVTAELWSVGGIDSWFFFSGRTLFREAPAERCYSIYADVPWLTALPSPGKLAPGAFGITTLTVDAGALGRGTYTATLVVSAMIQSLRWALSQSIDCDRAPPCVSTDRAALTSSIRQAVPPREPPPADCLSSPNKTGTTSGPVRSADRPSIRRRRSLALPRSARCQYNRDAHQPSAPSMLN